MYHTRLFSLIIFMMCAIGLAPVSYCFDGDSENIPVTTHQNKKTNKERGNESTTSISVWLNTNDKTITIESDGDDDAVVYILNSRNQIVSFNSTINSPLDVSDLSNGRYTIYIEFDDFYSYGYFSI